MIRISISSAEFRLLPVLLAMVVLISASPAVTQPSLDSSTAPDLSGTFQLVPLETKLPGGLKDQGTLEDISLQPDAAGVAKSRDLKEDPVNMCQAIGPFRMMAREGNKIELLNSPGNITLLFEDIARGNRREIYLTRGHPGTLEPTWEGDTVGHWENDTLVADTVGFNDKTWLNGAGAPHSDALHLVERYRLVMGGKYLELKMTAEDPKSLTKPYNYTRYYKRLKTEIMENECIEAF